MLVLGPAQPLDRAALRSLEDLCSHAGYTVAQTRNLSGERIRELRLAHRLFKPYKDAASLGGPSAGERLRLLQIYDSPEFVHSYGARPQALEIQPVEQFLDQTGIPIDTIKDWCQQLFEAHPLDSGAIGGVNTIGNCKVVSVFAPPDSAPVFLTNPHVYSILDSYETPGSSLCTFHLKPAGTKAPSRKTLKGELEKVWASPHRMSRSALESARDLWVWFGVHPQDTVL